MFVNVRNFASERLATRANFLAVLCCIGVSSCASLPTVSTNTSYCCEPAAEQVQTYRIEFEDMPEFLKPMLRDEVSHVLHAKDLEYTEGQAHAVLKMAYVDKTYEGPDTRRDEAWETTAPAGGMRFIAEVQMELRNTVTNELIWAGSMSRVHNVYEGSYMHEEPARAAMRRAFTELFAGLPDPVLDEY